MNRRHFLAAAASSGLTIAGCSRRVMGDRSGDASFAPMGSAEFQAARRFAATSFGRIAYVERGKGPAALFIHGYPLNGFQWRGALERLSAQARCVAPDLMGLGYTEIRADQDLSPQAQTNMLVSLLDALSVDSAHVVANDSGGTIAQLLVVQHPARVRTLLLTNCDVHENSPPAGLGRFMELARAGKAADQWLAPQLEDVAFARSEKGLGGGAYTNPANLTDEAIRYYFTPLLSSPVRREQFNDYAVAFEPNPLPAIEPALRRCAVPARMVWGTR